MSFIESFFRTFSGNSNCETIWISSNKMSQMGCDDGDCREKAHSSMQPLKASYLGKQLANGLSRAWLPVRRALKPDEIVLAFHLEAVVVESSLCSK